MFQKLQKGQKGTNGQTDKRTIKLKESQRFKNLREGTPKYLISAKKIASQKSINSYELQIFVTIF